MSRSRRPPEHHVGDKVGVAVEALLGYAVVAHVIPVVKGSGDNESLACNCWSNWSKHILGAK